MIQSDAKPSLNFVQEIIEADNRTGKWDGRVRMRFPPEPNGYLHIGHAKSICLNFGLAERYGGKYNLRFDDTNPIKEEEEYVRSIIEDIRWLGFDWEDRLYYASDYFEQMYEYAVELIKKGRAYVCDLTSAQVREHRGALKRPGKDSPHRNRGVHENLDLFERMRKGEFPDGSRTLRAKIDMAHPNLNMRDPVMYRILFADHHRTGNKWCIYPMYDWAHGLGDSIEGITHSICTLEFENHRPLYDWFIDAINEGRGAQSPWGPRIVHSQQIEFARLELTCTVMSKRKLLELVESGRVGGWDDPRMPTLSGLRRRGYTPESVRNFCADIGVAKFNSMIEVVRLENALRDHLNKTAERRMGVLRPLKVVIENWPDGEPEPTSHPTDSPAPSNLTPHASSLKPQASSPKPQASSRTPQASRPPTDWLDAVNNPEDPSAGKRKVPFSRVLYIEREDFREDAPRKFFRLAPGREVRLRYAYFITCTEVVKDADGEVVELRCTYDPATRGGDSPDGRKVKGTLHWVSAEHAIDAEIRLYDRLFTDPDPDHARHEKDYKEFLNSNSLDVLTGCKLEPGLADVKPGDRYQFERQGYFCVDPDSTDGKPVFNRTVSLKDKWARIEKRK